MEFSTKNVYSKASSPNTITGLQEDRNITVAGERLPEETGVSYSTSLP